MPILSDRALEGLKNYKYSAGGYTWLDRLHEPAWKWIVNRLPMWLAPNLITLIGTLGVVATYATYSLYSPDFSVSSPPWLNLMSAITMFVYLNLDCMDGKQARRTGSSSPLGQLFDHGCDALITFMSTTNLANALKQPFGGMFSVSFTMALCIWALAQWVEYHTGHMHYGNAYFGIMEATYCLAVAPLISFIAGDDFWSIKIPVGRVLPQSLQIEPLPISAVIVYGVVSSCIYQTIFQLYHVFISDEPKKLKASDEAGNKELGKVAALKHCCYFVALLCIGAYLMYQNVQDPVLARCVNLMYGCSYSYIATQLIVAHMCREPFVPHWGPFVSTSAVLLSMLYFRDHDVKLVIVGTTVCSILHYLFYVSSVVHVVCKALNIKCFVIPVKAYKAI